MLTTPDSADRRSQQGFTLLEIMVAVSIMAIVLVAVYQMHLQTISMTGAARFHAVAPFLAQRILSEVERQTDSRPTDDSGDFGAEFEGYTWRSTVRDMVSELLGSVSEDLKQIDITVAYNENEQVFTLRSYRLMR